MILLAGTSAVISLVTSSTANIAVHASYIDNNAGTITPNTQNTLISSAATTTILSSPGASTQRNLKTMTINNTHASSSNTITIQHNDGTTTVQLFKLTLAAGESVRYDESNGWEYINVNGALQAQYTVSGVSTSGVSASPTGAVSTTEKAMGLGLVAGFTLTPVKTGNVIVIISGMALNSSAAGDGTNITGRFGTGTAPSNGATTGLGTAFGTVQHFVGSTTAGQQGFTVMGKITGNAIGTALWFDVSLLAVTAGGSTVKDVQIIAFEVA